MKPSSFFTCFFIFCCCFTTFAQSDFAAVGTKWTYTQGGVGIMPNSTNHWPYVLESINEEMYQGHLCKKILDHTTINDFSYYVYSEGDSVFYWDLFHNQFALLYNFSAQAGYTWIIEMPDNSPAYITVDSVGFIVVNNDTLKTWYISYTEHIDWGKTIVEGIGSTFFFIPYIDNDDLNIYEIRCFESSLESYAFVDYPCDSVYTTIFVDINESEEVDPIKIYPNPASGQITLKCPFLQGETLTMALFDLSGRQLRSEQFINNGLFLLDASAVPNGLYQLQVLHETKVLKNLKMSIVH